MVIRGLLLYFAVGMIVCVGLMVRLLQKRNGRDFSDEDGLDILIAGLTWPIVTLAIVLWFVVKELYFVLKKISSTIYSALGRRKE